MSSRVSLISAGLLILSILAPTQSNAQPCSTQIPATTFSINQAFANGTRWTFNFGRNPCEGLVLLFANFTPRNGAGRSVLYRGSISQIHVPYHPGSPRFLDVGISTAGLGANAVVLAPAECPGGTLWDGNRICSTLEDRGYAYKYGSAFARGQELTIFMSSQLGQYNYINLWAFQDDGGIEVRTGLTGHLQVVNPGPEWLPYGSRINPESDPTPSVGINHQHNIYYRLDFDIGTSNDNAVNQIYLQPSFTPSPAGQNCAANGQCFVMQENQLLTETVDYISPYNVSSWRIYNKNITNASGRRIGYELVPQIEGLNYGMYDTTEPWALGELWVTRYNACHLLATNNAPPLIGPECAGTEDNISAMVAGAGDIDGQDVVIWYANRFNHFVRDEDQVAMPIEWMTFRVQPRSFHHHNPMEP